MIPATAHFIWFGTELPFIYMVGFVRSGPGGFETVVLHHADDLSGTPLGLFAANRLEARRLRPDALPEMHGDLGHQLLSLFGELEKLAARANLMRAAILPTKAASTPTPIPSRGGSYPLRRSAAVFCGDESSRSRVRSRTGVTHFGGRAGLQTGSGISSGVCRGLASVSHLRAADAQGRQQCGVWVRGQASLRHGAIAADGGDAKSPSSDPLRVGTHLL